MKEKLISIPDVYTYDPEELGLRLDETIAVLKEFRGKLPKELTASVDATQIGYIQAILNVVDYLEVPHRVDGQGAAEA